MRFACGAAASQSQTLRNHRREGLAQQADHTLQGSSATHALLSLLFRRSTIAAAAAAAAWHGRQVQLHALLRRLPLQLGTQPAQEGLPLLPALLQARRLDLRDLPVVFGCAMEQGRERPCTGMPSAQHVAAAAQVPGGLAFS